MSITQSLSRAGLSLVLVGFALTAACADDADGTNTDEQSEVDGGDSSGGSATTRAGRGGSGATATAGRSAAAAGRGATGGSRAATAGQGGRRSGAAGTVASAGRASVPPLGSAAGRSAAGAGGTGDADDAGVDNTPTLATLSDGQIAEVTNVVNASEINLGTLAVNRGVSAAVIDYAQVLVTQHQEAQERQTAVAIAVGVIPSPSSLSAQLTEDAVRIRTQLELASAEEFDVLYVRSQVELHQLVLTAIDEQLLPNVTADTLRSDLVVTRAQVAGHLDSARALLATLEGVDGADAGTP